MVDYTETLLPNGAATATGPTKEWFDLGTLHGTYKLSGKLVGMAATLTGTAKLTGGTGAYKGARGTAKLSCATKNAGATISCTYTLRFTRL